MFYEISHIRDTVLTYSDVNKIVSKECQRRNSCDIVSDLTVNMFQTVMSFLASDADPGLRAGSQY